MMVYNYLHYLKYETDQRKKFVNSAEIKSAYSGVVRLLPVVGVYF